MEKQELESKVGALYIRNNINDLIYWLPRNSGNVDDNYEVLDVMSAAYSNLTQGVHENVNAWCRGESPLLQEVKIPTYYVNGIVAATKSKFLITELDYNYNDRQEPEFIDTYTKARDSVYNVLLDYALFSNNFSPLLSTIDIYKESTLAKKLYKDLHARKEPYPDMIAGDADLVRGRITERNRRIKAVQQGLGQYAIINARQKHRLNAKSELRNQETGLLKTIAIGANFKLLQPRSKAKYRRKIVEKPLEDIMKLPAVPIQLIRQEKTGLSLLED